MANVQVQREVEEGRGWCYAVRLCRDDGSVSEHTVRLAWVDHDHWSGGRVSPSRTIEALLRYVVERVPAQEWPAAFDAARARRWVPELDRELPRAI